MGVPRWTAGVRGATPMVGVIVVVYAGPLEYCGTRLRSLAISGVLAVALVAPTVLPGVAFEAPTDGAAEVRWTCGVTSIGAPLPGNTTVCPVWATANAENTVGTNKIRAKNAVARFACLFGQCNDNFLGMVYS